VEIVKATLFGIRRTVGTAPNCKDPLTAERVRAMVKLAPDRLVGLRDRRTTASRWLLGTDTVRICLCLMMWRLS
jgi:hypothetical protein